MTRRHKSHRSSRLNDCIIDYEGNEQFGLRKSSEPRFLGFNAFFHASPPISCMNTEHRTHTIPPLSLVRPGSTPILAIAPIMPREKRCVCLTREDRMHEEQGENGERRRRWRRRRCWQRREGRRKGGVRRFGLSGSPERINDQRDFRDSMLVLAGSERG